MFSDLIMKDVSIARKKFTVILEKDFVYENDDIKIVVCKGFDYDLASIPQIFQNLISKVGLYDCAATIHDWLYAAQAIDRSEADKIFRNAMKESGVGFVERWTMYYAVHIFSYFIYKACAKDAKMYKQLGCIVRKR